MKPITEPVAQNWLRVVDPDWDDPVDASFAARTGGRWNPTGTPALYLCDSSATAQGQVRRLCLDRFLELEDLADDALDMVTVTIPSGVALDAHTDAGLHAVNLPTSYPLNDGRSPVGHETCQPIGASAYDQGLDGVHARSAAPQAQPHHLELAWFPRGRAATPGAKRVPFGRWR